MAQLSDAQVVELRERYAAGETQTALAEAFGVGQTSVSAIVKGRTRAAAGGPIAAPVPRRARSAGTSDPDPTAASSRRKATAPLTVDQVAAVKARVTRGESRAAVATAMGLSKHTIDSIMSGRRTGRASAEDGRVPTQVVSRMREMHDAGATQAAIAAELGVSQQRVSQVLRAAK